MWYILLVSVKKRYNSGQLVENERSDSQLSLNESDSVTRSKDTASSDGNGHKVQCYCYMGVYFMHAVLYIRTHRYVHVR